MRYLEASVALNYTQIHSTITCLMETVIFRTDEMADYSARTTVPDFIRPGVFTPRQSSGWSWTALRNINYFLENVSTSPLPQDVKDHYTGLARFFRAWFYYDKV